MTRLAIHNWITSLVPTPNRQGVWLLGDLFQFGIGVIMAGRGSHFLKLYVPCLHIKRVVHVVDCVAASYPPPPPKKKKKKKDSGNRPFLLLRFLLLFLLLRPENTVNGRLGVKHQITYFSSLPPPPLPLIFNFFFFVNCTLFLW